jgi:hypothetical protein
MVNKCRDAMRKWCKSKGIDFATLPPIAPPSPPVGMGPRPFGPVRDVQFSEGFDPWDYALDQAAQDEYDCRYGLRVYQEG